MRNDRPAKRSLNYFRHRLQRDHRKASSAIAATTTTTTATTPTATNTTARIQIFRNTTAAVAPPSTVGPSLAMHGSNAMPGDFGYQSYARTAHILLATIHGWAIDVPLILPPDHPIVQYLSPMRNKTVAMIQHVMRTFTLHQLNQLRPSGASVNPDGTRPPAGPIWSTDHDIVQLIDRTVDAYFECTVRHNATPAGTPRSHRKLVIVQFSHPGLDEVGLGRVLNEPAIMASIPKAFREAIGRPMVAFKYAKPLGLQWHNTRRFAHMSDATLHTISNSPCGCHLISDEFKKQGNLRTSDPTCLPTDNLQHLCAMGAKFRPGLESAIPDASSKTGMLASFGACQQALAPY